MRQAKTWWILLGAMGTLAVIIAAVVALVWVMRSRSGHDRAVRARARLREGLTFSEVDKLVTNARASFVSGDVPQCQRPPNAEVAACHTLSIVFGEDVLYAFDVSFGADGRVVSLSPLRYEE